MQQQITPWSIYQKGFKANLQTKTLKVPFKKILTPNPQNYPLLQIKKVQSQKQKAQKETKSDKQSQVQESKNSCINAHQSQKNQSYTRQQQQKSLKINTQQEGLHILVQELFVLKFLRNQLVQIPTFLSLPKIKQKNVLKNKDLRIQNKNRTHGLIPQDQRSIKQKSEQKIQRLKFFSYSPFDDTQILRRGIQVLMKRKASSKKKETKLIYKLIHQ